MVSSRSRVCALGCVCWLVACSDDGAKVETSDASATQAEAATGTAGDGDGEPGDGDGDPGDGDPGDGDGDGDPGEVAGLELMTRLAGLWSGPATMTPLGTFELMNMDMRPVGDDHVLFGRVDLDAANSLRFAFSIETIAGQDRLVYRNGGYFLGMLRDSRTILESTGPDTWRFCAVDGGCDYIDATWEFSSPTEVVLDVFVHNQQHVLWIADRLEARELPDPFPVDASSQGNGDAPFPDMPTLSVDVSWQDPLVDPADVWILLSVQDCPLMGFCEFSRWLYATAEPGATQATLNIEQVHPGPYELNAILDRDQNAQQTLVPTSGDAVSLPNQAVDVAATGTSNAQVVILVEL